MGKAVGLVALIVLAACQTPAGDFCDIARAQRPSAAEIEAMTDERVAEVLAHNRKGQAMCGWRP